MYEDDRRGGGFRPRGESGRGFGGGSGGGFSPVNVGEELDVKIEAVGEKGDGIARKNGFVLFVPNTHEGDEVRIRVTKVLRKVGFAEVVGASKSPSAADTGSKPKKEESDFDDEEEQDQSYDEPPQDSEDFGEDDSEDSKPIPKAPKPAKEGYDDSSDDGFSDSQDDSGDGAEDDKY